MIKTLGECRRLVCEAASRDPWDAAEYIARAYGWALTILPGDRQEDQGHRLIMSRDQGRGSLYAVCVCDSSGADICPDDDPAHLRTLGIMPDLGPHDDWCPIPECQEMRALMAVADDVRRALGALPAELRYRGLAVRGLAV